MTVFFKGYLRVLCLPMIALFSVFAQAGESEVRAAIQATLPQFNVSKITSHDASGLYVVEFDNGNTLYATANGDYFVAGDLYHMDNGNLVNETEQVKLAKLEAWPTQDMVIYAADEEKAHITVFTDVDCGYCRMLHNEVPQLNALGITVRYLAFPRAGVGSGSYDKMVSVWCSDDPKALMDKAKRGMNIPENKCVNPVAEQYALGIAMGVKGTPTVVLSTGAILPGYLPAAELAKELGL